MSPLLCPASQTREEMKETDLGIYDQSMKNQVAGSGPIKFIAGHGLLWLMPGRVGVHFPKIWGAIRPTLPKKRSFFL